MLGLIEKDMRLLLQRKSTLFIILGISVFMSFSMDPSFIVGYLVVLGVLFASGTISYDEYDNGYAFLMTLPIEKKTYVAEKYVFCMLSGFVLWIFASILYFVSSLVRGIGFDMKESLLTLGAFIPVIIFMTAIMIPFPLKFGAEKGRVYMALLCGVLIGLGALIGKGIESAKVSLDSLVETVNRIPNGVLILLGCCFLVALLWISYLWSRRIMEKKSF